MPCGSRMRRAYSRHGSRTGQVAQIALARAQEAEHSLGIEYLVRDCRSLSLPSEFDVAAAAYLLNYAGSTEVLAAMASS